MAERCRWTIAVGFGSSLMTGQWTAAIGLIMLGGGLLAMLALLVGVAVLGRPAHSGRALHLIDRFAAAASGREDVPACCGPHSPWEEGDRLEPGEDAGSS
ncbi:hypothetical protein [Actinomadura sp. NPDC000929]|uniref:hypothetical protein n=1 Tax=Actinomadura sp. NPDC000929 TaxID=3154517 RepID=UPI0033912800